jgi:hypothetical protein
MKMSELLQEYWGLYAGKPNLQVDMGNGFLVAVEVTDLRQCWNRVDAKVKPISGSGEIWIEARRLIQII